VPVLFTDMTMPHRKMGFTLEAIVGQRAITLNLRIIISNIFNLNRVHILRFWNMKMNLHYSLISKPIVRETISQRMDISILKKYALMGNNMRVGGTIPLQ